MRIAHHFLYATLLEGRELGRPSLHVQLTLALILLASFADAAVEGRDFATLHILEDFGPARVASVGVDLQERLDFGDTRDYAANGDEFAEVRTANLAHGEDRLVGEWPEVEVAARVVHERVSLGTLRRPSRKDSALSPQQLRRENRLARFLVLRVLVIPVVLDHVEHV